MNIRYREELLPLTPQVYHILAALLAANVMSGADVLRQMQQDTHDVDANAGTIYPALKRLKQMKLIKNPTLDPRTYQISDFGLTVLGQEADRLRRAASLGEKRINGWASRPDALGSAEAILEFE